MLQLVDETAVETGDGHLVMTRDQFAEIDPQFRRRLAANANTDEINGKSTAYEIENYFARQRTLTDYVEG